MNKNITIETLVKADIRKVWDMWVNPEHITNWAFASDDWECTNATNDVKVGGKFSSSMGAKDKSSGFDFSGSYTAVEEEKLLAYTLDDGRKVVVSFEQTEEGVRIIQTFEPENENPEEMQRGGWQAILDNFKKYVEASDM